MIQCTGAMSLDADRKSNHRMTEHESGPTLAELVERTRRRDERAFAALVKVVWWRVMLHIVRGRVPAHDRDAVAYDAAESLYEAIRKSQAPDGSNPASFFACVRTITKRRVVDYQRSRRPLPEKAIREIAASRSAANDTSPEFEPPELAAVEECLGGIEEKRRYWVISYFFQGLSTRALERQTGTPASTIRVKIGEALAWLRDCLRSHGVDVEPVSGRGILR